MLAPAAQFRRIEMAGEPLRHSAVVTRPGISPPADTAAWRAGGMQQFAASAHKFDVEKTTAGSAARPVEPSSVSPPPSPQRNSATVSRTLDDADILTWYSHALASVDAGISPAH